MHLTWPLLGREVELDELDPVFEDTGGTTGVVLSGPAGVGKSRLLRELFARAGRRGYRTELVEATRAASSVPLAAVSALLPGDPPNREHDGHDLFALTVRRMRARAPVLLAVDDAHLLDEGSAGLVHRLVAEGCVTLVATVVAGQRVADAITALWEDELVRCVVVPALPDLVVDELVRHALPGRVSGATHARLRRLAAGNPLYLRELLNAGVTTGALRERDGLWQWSGDGGGWRLHELVRARLDAAGAAGRAVTELVACGEPVPLAMVEDRAGVTAAERAGLLEVVVERRRSSVRLAHPVYGEVLRSALPPPRGRAIHRELLRALRRTSMSRRDDLLRMATWQLTAGEPADLQVLVPAAWQAVARHDLVLAERLARRAADTGQPGAVSLLSRVLELRGHRREGVAPLAGRPPGGPVTQDRARRASSRFVAPGRSDDAARARRNASGTGTGGPRAMALLAQARLDETIEAARPVLSSPDERVDARVVAYAASVFALSMLGHTQNALLLAGDGEALLRAHPDEVLLGGAYLRIARCGALLITGAFGQARELAEERYQAAADRSVRALWAVQRGVVAQLRGDIDLATASLYETVILDQEDHRPAHPHHQMVLAGSLALAGDTVAAQRWQARADDHAGEIHRVLRSQAECNRATVFAAVGDRRRAVDSALRAAALARECGQVTQEAHALFEATRHGAANQVSTRLTELVGRTDSELTAVFADCARARARNDGRLLDELVAGFEALDTPLLAAETAFAAGDAHQRVGQTRRAAIAFERGHLLAARCPGARTAGLVVTSTSTNLTARERQIARLAAGGMTSGEIAGSLGLSVRTIDNRLGHVYAKFGISGRAELAGVLAEYLE